MLSVQSSREIRILRRYYIQKREDYMKYRRIVGEITSIAASLKKLDPSDPVRIESTQQLLDKLFMMGIIPARNTLALVDELSASALCRRRLPVVMFRLKMAQTLKEAVTFIEQGHVRVGTETVTDPAFLVTRAMEDLVTWTDSSKIRRQVAQYNDKLDDFE